MELLNIKNTGDKPMHLKHDGKGDVTIDPGQARILPADYAFIHFGHPAARNVGRDKKRDIEFSNCRTLWGFYPGLMPEEAWETSYKPRFECYDLDDNRVYMVIDDPDGSLARARGGAASSADSDAVERRTVEGQIAAMQAQIDQLTKALVGQHSGLPVDGPQESLDADPEQTQEQRNEQRDDIPAPADDEPPVTSDKPRSARVGPRSSRSSSRSS